ncbi:unnamed protein product [Symbiodinium microadriaticum]|nr:unnamed protein product [Symbiodinium microadriaticum]CAE7360733.1 unnamed protein product [Symbiodinium sp. KB8]
MQSTRQVVQYRSQLWLALRSRGFGQTGTNFADIIDFVPLQVPEFAVHQGGAERAWTEVFELTDACTSRLLNQSMLDGSSTADRIAEIVRRFVQDGVSVAGLDLGQASALRPTSALQLTPGLCFLVWQKIWRTIALVPGSRWDAGCDIGQLLLDVRSQARGCEKQGQSLTTFLPPTELQPAHQFFNLLADDLCEWGRAIISSSTDPDTTASELEQYVIWLNSMREATSTKRVLEHIWEPIFSADGKRLQAGRFSKVFGVEGKLLLHCAGIFFHLAGWSKEIEQSDAQDAGVSVDDLRTILEATDEIRRATFRHTFPPTALGVRQSTLTHKIHAFLHSLRLEHSTWTQLQSFLKSTSAFTSDMGTEMKFNLASVDIADFFPRWGDGSSNSHLSLDFGDDAGSRGADAGMDYGGGIGEVFEQPAEQVSNLDLTGPLYIPGMFHVIDNATKDVLRKSEIWESSVRSMLESVLLFFNAFHRRKWFVAKCCVGVFQSWSRWFEGASPKLEGGRAWGVVSSGVTWVLERRHILQRSWDSERLLAGGADAESDAGGQETTKLVTRVDEAIGSPMFWAFLELCGTITSMLDEITRWTQGCACHGRALRSHLEPLLRGQGPLSCPMRGRRAPEIAEGALGRLIDDLFRYNDSQLALMQAANLPDEDRTRLLLDWSAMKVHMRMQFSLKLSPWNHLPLSSLGLGHWDQSVAQRMLWDSLVEWENLSEEQRETSHPHSRRLFRDLRTEVLAFIRSEPSDRWPSLELLRARAAFTPVLEQSIERRHAILHQHLKCAPHHSAPFVSLCERKDEVIEVVSNGEAEKLAQYCEKTRSPSLVATALGLTLHEEFAPHLDAVTGTLSVSIPHTLVASVVYRCDLRTQYKVLPAVHKRPQAPGVPPQDALLDGQVAEPPEEVVAPSSGFLRSVLQYHAWEHLGSSAVGAGDFYSIPVEQALPVDSAALMLPLSDAVSGAKKHAKIPLSLCGGPQDAFVEMNFDDDDGAPTADPPAHAISDAMLVHTASQSMPSRPSESSSSSVPAETQQRYVFFRVIAGKPASKKLARTDAVLQLRTDHIAVERCAIHQIDVEQKQVSVSLNASASEPQLFQRPASLGSCLQWTAMRTKPCFRGFTISQESEAAVEAMLQAAADLVVGGQENDALQGSLELRVHAARYDLYHKGLMELQALGFVQSRMTSPEVTTWTFTDLGRDSFRQAAVLHNPVNLLWVPAARSQVRNLNDLSVLQLIARLQDAGFEFEARTAECKAEPPAFNTSTGRPKKWYMRDKSVHVCRYYLLALLSSADLREKGHQQVRHLQSAKYYKELCEVKSSGRRTDKALKGHGILMLPDHGSEACLASTDPSRRQSSKRKKQSSGVPAIADRDSAGEIPVPEEGDGDTPAPVRRRAVHAKSFRWGAAAFTFKPPHAYQVTCPRICTHRHTGGHNTLCKKTKSFARPEDEDLVIRQLKFWVCQAPDFASRRDHIGRCEFLDPPADEDLESRKLPSDYETEDEELRPVLKRRRGPPRIGGETNAPAAKAKGKAKGKASSKGKAKAKATSKSRHSAEGVHAAASEVARVSSAEGAADAESAESSSRSSSGSSSDSSNSGSGTSHSSSSSSRSSSSDSGS